MHIALPFIALNVAFAYAGVSKRAAGCNNAGLQYAAFNNPFAHNDGQGYSDFDPTYMKAMSAGGQGASNLYYNGTTTMAGGFTSEGLPNGADSIQIYGSSNQIPLYSFAVNHRGYIKATKSGTYTLTFSNVDDIVLLWTGANAMSGWTRNNADTLAIWTTADGNGMATASYKLTAGQYLPIRIIYANCNGPFGLTVTGVNPNGNKFLTGTSRANAYIVSHSCNKRAPVFPYAFGQEQ